MRTTTSIVLASLLCSCLGKPPGLDMDGDGYEYPEDCDDNAADFHPGAEEIWYDGADQDCDGQSDYDQDGDGFDHRDHGGDDCDDTDAAVNPEAAEQYYDGVDQDCDEHSDFDKDWDGYDSEADAGGDDCDDGDPSINPGAEDTWYDGVDSDCGGEDDYDQDGDGFPSDQHGGDDCDDLDKDVNPDAPEILDNDIDDDCNGMSDEVPWAGGSYDVGVYSSRLVGEPSTYSGFGYSFSEAPIDFLGVDALGTAQLNPGRMEPDGFGELLVSAPLAGVFGDIDYGEEAVYVVAGGPTASLTSDDIADRTVLRLDPGNGGGWFGNTVAWVPSVDDDDVPEILVGAPAAGFHEGDDAGRALLFRSEHWHQASSVPSEGGGAIRRLNAESASTIFISGASGDGFGDVTCLGDFDQDGGGDIAITAPDLGGDGYVSGSEPGAIIIFGSDALSDPHLAIADPDDADLIIRGDANHTHLGFAPPITADLDGSGRDDLIVSAPGNDGDLGRVALWKGESATAASVDLLDLDWQLSGISGCQRAGLVLESGSDLDGDGYLDLGLLCEDGDGEPVLRVIGGQTWSTNTDTTVQAVTLLKVEGLDLPTGRDTLPFSLAADHNGDGYGELVTGSPAREAHNGGGLVSVWYGAPGFSGVVAVGEADAMLAGTESDWLGYTALTGMDLDFDGLPELVMGASGYDPGVVAGLHRPGALYLADPELGLQEPPSMLSW